MNGPDGGAGDVPDGGTEDVPGPPRGNLRELVAFSLFTGLCPLIPVPLVDDWVRDLLRTRLAARLAAAAGAAVSDAEVKILACGYRPPSATGCARGCLRTAVVRPVVFLTQLIFRKLVRKVLVFLAVKDSVDTFSQTFHEAYLLRHALSIGALEPPSGPGAPAPASVAPATAAPAPAAGPDPRLLAVRGAIEAVVAGADTRTVTTLARSVLAGSWRALARTARQVPRLLRRWRRSGEQAVSEHVESEGEARLGGLIDELTADLERRSGYLEALAARLEAQLGDVAIE